VEFEVVEGEGEGLAGAAVVSLDTTTATAALAVDSTVAGVTVGGGARASVASRGISYSTSIAGFSTSIHVRKLLQ
jgi:hypothetical protein